MTSRCPQCGKSLRAHLGGGACNILNTATARPRAPSTSRRKHP